MRKILFLLLPLVLFVGCGPPEYTIVADPVWMEGWQKGEGEGELVKALEKETGKNISFMPGELVGDRGYIEDILARSRGEKVVLSPLFSGAVDPQMAVKTGKKVILLSYSPQNGGESSVSIRLSRREAYRKAGEACARMLLEKSDVYGNSAAAVFYTATPRRREEMELFKAGFTSLKGAEALKIFEIAGIEDRKTIRPFLDEVKRSNIRLVMLSASRLNIFCIEECSKGNNCVIIEEGSGFEAFQENICGSIEIDQFGLLKTALSVPFDALSGTVVEAEFVQK